MGVGKALDEREELPFQSKSLEQQHWYAFRLLCDTDG
jgi:hypothetical protein